MGALKQALGNLKDQFVRFDPKKSINTTATGNMFGTPRLIDKKYMIQRRALDMYNALEDLQAAVEDGNRNVILPVQYPSVNKTYYQLAYWDGSRLAG